MAPAPTARQTMAGSRAGYWASIGDTMPAAVIMDTVAEPTEKRMTAGTDDEQDTCNGTKGLFCEFQQFLHGPSTVDTQGPIGKEG